MTRAKTMYNIAHIVLHTDGTESYRIDATIYASIAAAHAAIGDITYLSPGEMSADDIIISTDLAAMITACHDDLSLYDWGRYDVVCKYMDEHGNQCGECDECYRWLIAQDIDSIRHNAITV